jgi:hypothetical protein
MRCLSINGWTSRIRIHRRADLLELMMRDEFDDCRQRPSPPTNRFAVCLEHWAQRW